MSRTYSTTNREMAAGRVYSTQRQAGTGPTLPPRSTQPRQPQARAQSPAPAVPPRRFRFQLSPANLPSAVRMPGVSGAVRLEGRPGENYQIEAELNGLIPPPDPAIQPALWLIHDLTVPMGLGPADLATLPRGGAGLGNQPGTVFTLDGNPPAHSLYSNTLSVAVSPGRFSPAGGGVWRLQAVLDPGQNQAFHPLYFAGPSALADINTPVPSGTLANILTDLFMRQATVHPELPLQSRYLDRLKAITSGHLGPGQASVLEASGFTRAAVTLEGVLRPTPVLMPTRESCILLGSTREES